MPAAALQLELPHRPARTASRRSERSPSACTPATALADAARAVRRARARAPPGRAHSCRSTCSRCPRRRTGHGRHAPVPSAPRPGERSSRRRRGCSRPPSARRSSPAAARCSPARGPRCERLGERAGALLATTAVANGLFAGDPVDLGHRGRLRDARWPRELLPRADVVVAFGASLNQWTTRHGTLIGADAAVVAGRPRRGRDRRAPARRRGVVGDAREATAEALAGALGERAAPSLAHAASWRRRSPRGAGATSPTRSLALRRRHRPAHAEHRARRPAARRADGRRRLRPLHGLAVDVPARARRARGFVFPQAFQSVGLGLGNAIGAAIARPDRRDGRRARRRRRAPVAAGARDARAPGLPLLVVVVYDDAAYGAEVHHFGPMGHDVDIAQLPRHGLRRARRARPAAAASPCAALDDLDAGARSGSRRATGPLRRRREGRSRPSAPTGSRTPSDTEHRGGSPMPTSTARLARRPRRTASATRVVDLTQPLSERTPVLAAARAVRQHAAASRAHRAQPLRRPRAGVGVERARDRRARRARTSTRRSTGSRAATARTSPSVPPARLVGPAVVIDRSAEAADDPGLPADRRRRRARSRPSTARLPEGGVAAAAHRLGRAGPRRRGRSSTSAGRAPRHAGPGRRVRALAGRGAPASSASASRRSGPTPARRAASTRRSRCTASCSAPASTASPSSPTWPQLPPTGAVLDRGAAEARARHRQPDAACWRSCRPSDRPRRAPSGVRRSARASRRTSDAFRPVPRRSR